MKKLYIGLILLFGFLIFVPQIALGDAIALTPEEERMWLKLEEAKAKRQKKLKKWLPCVYGKKLKLPQEYSGPNLKLERVFYEGSDYSHIHNIDNTGNEYIIETTTKKTNNTIQEGFIGRDCTEYIEFPNYLYVYNVTDVPAGSRLRYISATEEMEVLPPADDSQKKFMDEQKERMRKSYEYTKQKDKKKREERNKKILFIIFYSSCISVLLFIIIRAIRRSIKNKVVKS